MRRFEITLAFAFGKDDDRDPPREGSADTVTELAHPDPDARAEMDSRNRDADGLGFRGGMLRPSAREVPAPQQP